MKYGLIGERLGHSFSAEIHSQIPGYEYELKEIAPENIAQFMEAKDFCGINVTIPYKQTVIPYLDYVDEKAKSIGAVNTVINRDGKLYGYNTDFGGLLLLIKRYLNDLSGKKALILGDGGTSLTAKAVLEHLNAKEIYVVSRHKGDGKISYEDAVKYHNDANFIVNTTPVGMFPSVDGCVIDIENFNNLDLVVDVVYNPLRTDLVLAAENKGVKAVGGLYMLIAQAVLAAGYFVGKVLDTKIIDQLYNAFTLNKYNIILTGMPGSGKSTIGKILAEKLNKPFIDTDAEIVKKTGKEITEIFAELGEAGFRAIESEVIAEVSLKDCCIISTGGGAILNGDNVRRLKHNGIIYFLDRTLDDLLPTTDRPLASSKEDIIKRYNERIDIYKNTNDFIINVSDTETTVNTVLNVYFDKNDGSVSINKSIATGSVKAPPSKSMSHRLLICAGLSKGKSVIKNIAYSMDVLATLDCLSELGAKITRNDDFVEIEGVDLTDINRSVTLNCRESGSTLRFFIPLLLFSKEISNLTGSKYLFTRPLDIYEKICEAEGLLFKQVDNSLSVAGVLNGGSFNIPGNVSSQFISGLLFALPLANTDSTIHIIPPVESRPYIDMTIAALKTFGVVAEFTDENTLFIKGNQFYTATNTDVEGDYSNAAFLDAFGIIGGNVEVLGLNENSLQGDKIYKEYFKLLKKSRPTIDVSSCPDLAPILITLATIFNGADFIGTKRLAIKESNRGKVMAAELKKFGADIHVFENKIIVNKSELHHPESMLYGHNDHRIVMSLSVISSIFGGEILGYNAVKKSYPDFFNVINDLGIKILFN